MKTNIKSTKLLGVALVLLAAILWGASGTVAQYLFQNHQFSAEWLVVIRLIISGMIMIVFAIFKGNRHVFTIWKKEKRRILIFGIIGMLGIQYTYFAAIQSSNAATATLLQYLGPVIIAIYIAIKERRMPTQQQSIAIGLALLGTFLIVTHGNIQQLSISTLALFWGIASAFALAFYTLNPIPLLKKYGSTVVVGWGMLIGGIGMSFVHPP